MINGLRYATKLKIKINETDKNGNEKDNFGRASKRVYKRLQNAGSISLSWPLLC